MSIKIKKIMHSHSKDNINVSNGFIWNSKATPTGQNMY